MMNPDGGFSAPIGEHLAKQQAEEKARKEARAARRKAQGKTPPPKTAKPAVTDISVTPEVKPGEVVFSSEPTAETTKPNAKKAETPIEPITSIPSLVEKFVAKTSNVTPADKEPIEVADGEHSKTVHGEIETKASKTSPKVDTGGVFVDPEQTEPETEFELSEKDVLDTKTDDETTTEGEFHGEIDNIEIELPEDPAAAIERDATTPPPPDVSRAVAEGVALDQEETEGVITPTREQEIEARLVLLGVENPTEYAAKYSRSIELRLRVLEVNAKRKELAEVEAKLLTASGKEKKELEENVKEKYKKYEQARANYVCENAMRLMRERARLTDDIAEKKKEQKGGLAKKLYDKWHALGQLSLDKVDFEKLFSKGGKMGQRTYEILTKKLEETAVGSRMEKILESNRVGKWVAKKFGRGNVGRFAAKFINVRTIISYGLFGAGWYLGATSAVGLSAMALRRGFAGIGAGFGNYDILRRRAEVGSEKVGPKFWRREMKPEDVSKMKPEDLTRRMEDLEAWARLNGQKISENKAYKMMARETRDRLETRTKEIQEARAEDIARLLIEEANKTDNAIIERAIKIKMEDFDRKLIGVGIGIFIGSGIFAKILGSMFGHHAEAKIQTHGAAGAREHLMGAVEKTPPHESVTLEAQGAHGETVTMHPDGEISYAPPTTPEAIDHPAALSEAHPEVPAEVTPVEITPVEVAPALPHDVLIEAHAGDNSWKMVARALHERFGDRFDHLDPAKKSWITDYIDKQVEGHPKDFGIRGAHLIREGDKLNLTKLFDDPKMEKAFSAAENLSPEKVASIAEHQSAVREFVREHPNTPLRSGDIDRIINRKIDDAAYESGLHPADTNISHMPVHGTLERIPTEPVAEVPTPEEAPTAYRMGLKFTENFSPAEQEAFAKHIEYQRDMARILKEDLDKLAEQYGDRPEFADVKSDIEFQISNWNGRAMAFNRYIGQTSQPDIINAWKNDMSRYLSQEYHPHMDAGATIREVSEDYKLILPGGTSEDLLGADIKEAMNDAARNAVAEQFHIPETPHSAFAEGIVKDATGHPLVKFEYNADGTPKWAAWQGKPDMGQARWAITFEAGNGWEKWMTPTERANLMVDAMNMDRYQHALDTLHNAGLGNTPEARFLKTLIDREEIQLGRAIVDVKSEAIAQGRLVPSGPPSPERIAEMRASHNENISRLHDAKAGVQPIATEHPAKPVPLSDAARTRIEDHSNALHQDMNAKVDSISALENHKLPAQVRIDEFREYLTTDPDHAINYDTVSFELKGDKILFKIGELDTRVLSPNNLDKVTKFMEWYKNEMPNEIVTLGEDGFKEKVESMVRDIYETKS